MNKMKWTQIALMASLLIMVSAAATQATVLRAFVSSTGNDANAASNCPQATPCKTFAGAFPVVTAGGELIALDTSGYGPLTINKAITVATVPGVTAFVVAATGTSGFTVSAGATDLVVLRNISFNGSNAASTTGLTHNSGKLFVENCNFQQLTTGISVVNAVMNLKNSNLLGNTTGASVSGAGFDNNNPGTPATALLTISGGTVAFNGTAFFMTNPGGGTILNIYMHTVGTTAAWATSLVGNTTFVAGTGTGCPCFTVGTYNSTLNPK